MEQFTAAFYGAGGFVLSADGSYCRYFNNVDCYISTNNLVCGVYLPQRNGKLFVENRRLINRIASPATVTSSISPFPQTNNLTWHVANPTKSAIEENEEELRIEIKAYDRFRRYQANKA